MKGRNEGLVASMKTGLFLLCAGLIWPPRAWADNRTLALDPGSSNVRIDVSATVDSFVAQLKDFDATITLDPAQGKVLSADFRFLFSHLLTGNEDRDAEMRVWEEAGRYPSGSFTLDSVDPGKNGRFLARGRLLFHGVERPVKCPFTVSVEGRVLTIDGAASLDTRDFGLPIFRKYFFLRVDPVVRVRFHLVGKLAS
jgi:polyisoprenoid-binding protein YceI